MRGGLFMKLLTLGAAIACQILTFASLAVCQEKEAQPERLHITRPFPETSPGRVELTASSIERDLSSKESESILLLKGNVEVRMITCDRSKSDDHGVVCDEGSMMLHADTVDYNEKTGEISARGNVHLTPYQKVPTTPVSK
jgi:lipopolysaccharide assembly outer membrane protein LptD (OstA)